MSLVESQLKSWRRRERLVRLGRAACLLVAAVLAALAVACLADYCLDRTRETPSWARSGLRAGQLILGAAALVALARRVGAPDLAELAARAEAQLPALGHRLVTAVQLRANPSHAAGASPWLLGELNREAEELAAEHRLDSLSESRPLWLALAVLTPVLVGWAGFAALRPALAEALVRRQLGDLVAIPRDITLVNLTPEVMPAGDPVRLVLRATGAGREGRVGTVRVSAPNEPDEELPLTARPEGSAPDSAVYAAELPATGAGELSFTAWLGDGRLSEPGRVRFEARPAVTAIEAEVILPKYLDPDGEREYRRPMAQGEVYALLDSEVVVSAEFSKPLKSATLRQVRRVPGAPEEVLAETPLVLGESRAKGEVRVPLDPRATGYRLDAVDDNGYSAAAPPFRGITLSPDAPPQVAFLAEALKDPKEPGPLDDYLVDGMPLRLGGQVQVGYSAKSPLGVARVYLVYRVNDGPWTPLPLTPTVADAAKVGPFVPELGVFAESGPYGQVEFYSAPAQDPEAEPDGLVAGGRVNFKTASLRKLPPGSREAVPLEVGDTVEVRVCAYDRRPGAARPASDPPLLSGGGAAPATTDPRRKAGWTNETRVKTVVTDAKFDAWRQEHYRTRVKLGELEQRQRDVFRSGKD